MKQFLLPVFCLFLFSCSKEQHVQKLEVPEGCKDTLFTFDKDILPIFTLNCNFSLCHGVSGDGSYDFTIYSVVANRTRAGTMEYRIDLPIDDPQHMPEKLRLSDCDYFIIKSWIHQGYPEN